MKTSKGPLGRYLRLCEAGELYSDEYQFEALKILEEIYKDIEEYHRLHLRNKDIENSSSDGTTGSDDSVTAWLASFFSFPPEGSEEHFKTVDFEHLPKGVYIYGSPGCGKSFLMDMLYDCISDKIPKKRVHFNSFMLDIHHRLHLFRQNNGIITYI